MATRREKQRARQKRQQAIAEVAIGLAMVRFDDEGERTYSWAEGRDTGTAADIQGHMDDSTEAGIAPVGRLSRDETRDFRRDFAATLQGMARAYVKAVNDAPESAREDQLERRGYRAALKWVKQMMLEPFVGRSSSRYYAYYSGW